MPSVVGDLKELRWTDTNTSASPALAMAARCWSDTVSSPSRVITVWKPRACISSRRRRAISSVTNFSETPSALEVPWFVPPWPASMATLRTPRPSTPGENGLPAAATTGVRAAGAERGPTLLLVGILRELAAGSVGRPAPDAARITATAIAAAVADRRAWDIPRGTERTGWGRRSQITSRLLSTACRSACALCLSGSVTSLQVVVSDRPRRADSPCSMLHGSATPVVQLPGGQRPWARRSATASWTPSATRRWCASTPSRAAWWMRRCSPSWKPSTRAIPPRTAWRSR